jgi:two-component system, NarL family, sensor histidine kinase LiaS
MALVFTPDGRIVASSYPARYPAGSSAYAAIPDGASFSTGKAGQISQTPTGRVAWAVQPIILLGASSNGIPPGGEKKFPSDADVYVQAPLQAATIASISNALPLLQAGIVLLILTLPVGVIFGILTTRGIVLRLGRLGATTARLAEGDLRQRLTPGRADEVGQLERDFNDMAERLQTAVQQERLLADKSARLAERSRISRELHDSISQDLFSLSLLAAGLQKALPADSPLRSELQALADTVESANREMRALLLELRPTTLEEKGLVPALEELVSTYRTRLGITVDAELEPVHLAPAGELASLRVAQEGVANAVKHASAKVIRLSLHRNGAGAEILVVDDGHGFDHARNGSSHGLGLKLMRERIEELGGSLTIQSDETGTRLMARLP